VFDRLTRFLLRRRALVLVATLAALVLAGVLGGGAVAKLKSGGFDDPAAEATKAAATLRDTFHTGDPNVVFLVTAHHGTVDDPDVAAVGAQLVRRLAGEPDLTEVTSYWSGASHVPALRSRDGRQALVLARSTVGDQELNQRAKQLTVAYQLDTPAASVEVGGRLQTFREISEQVKRDLAKADSLAIPVTLLLLVVVFSSAAAAVLPLAVGGFAIVGTLLVLRLLASVTDVSIYALNLTTALGLGLAVDYSLFIVSRYREELHAGRELGDALAVTMRTAGRTVLFSAATVAVSLLALLVFPLYFLRSFGYAGIAVVALAALGALVVLPALLALLGRRIDALRLPLRLPLRRRRSRTTAQVEGERPGGAWHRIALAVMRRPLPIGLAVVALLLVLGAPFLGVRFGLPDDRVLPTSATSRQVADAIRANFAAKSASALAVVATRTGGGTLGGGQLGGYALALSRLDGVARVDASSGSYLDGHKVASAGPAARSFSAPGDPSRTWLRVTPAVEPNSAAGERLVHDVRALPAPDGVQIQVTGPSARLVDTKASLFGHLPEAVAVIALVTFVVLWMMTGSVVIPLKALVLNLLSLSAVYGAMVFVFQDGHLSGVLGFTPTGTIDTSMPVLLFCVAFGLSMDYEVFLLSRIKEEHDRTGDTVAAVARGLERTGGIVTTLAALLAVVFIALATSRVTFLQLFGVGTALAIVADATLIRTLLVPAFMRLAGRANWWSPPPLRRLHARIGLAEAAPEPRGPIPAAASMAEANKS